MFRVNLPIVSGEWKASDMETIIQALGFRSGRQKEHGNYYVQYKLGNTVDTQKCSKPCMTLRTLYLRNYGLMVY